MSPRTLKQRKCMKPSCYFIGTSWHDAAVPAYFKALGAELARRGHRVVFLTGNEYKDEQDHTGNPALYTWPSRRPTKVKDAIFLARLIRRFRPDCVIAQFASVNWMMVVGWLMRVPNRMAWYQTLSRQIEIDSSVPKWKGWLLNQRKRFVYMLTTSVVSNSNAGRRDWGATNRMSLEKASVVYYCLRDPLLNGAASPEDERVGHIIVCVGRLDESKGQDVLIRALGLLKSESVNLEIRFVGDGPCRVGYEQLARELGVEEQCNFLGRLPHASVFAEMERSVLSVTPSRSDCGPWTVLESLAVGAPVVASDVGGIPEMIRDGVDGFLVPPDDPEALAEKIKLLLTDTELRETMGRNARERFLTEFELSRNIGRHADWFEEIVASRKGGKRRPWDVG